MAFRLLGLIPGSVGLRGSFVSCPDREGGEDRKDTVKASLPAVFPAWPMTHGAVLLCALRAHEARSNGGGVAVCLAACLLRDLACRAQPSRRTT